LKGNQLKGRKILVTAGPTREAIDAVRYISNRSSGKMGFAIAEEIIRRGGHVTLIAGPSQLEVPANANYIRVESASEMYNACMKHFSSSDITVMSAAVSDFSPVETATSKVKKEDASLNLTLKRTADILSELGNNKKKGQLLVGFALETTDGISFAREKLLKKNLDLIVLNTLADKGAGFDTETNKVTLIDKNGIEPFELKAKSEVAKDIVDKIIRISHA
jgi:phosphopantothenoylcysteine decarboxylase / phosphopantothenate---cysteine ligase